MQSAHNYAIGVLAARMARAVIAKGLDPCVGFFHDGRTPGRLSLVWDLVERFRPPLADAVFQYADRQVFRRDDFTVTAGGVIRVSAELARDIALLTIKTVSLRRMVQAVDWLARLF
jgi:CRISPR/Cas system-associated endonuclease Cas1